MSERRCPECGGLEVAEDLEWHRADCPNVDRAGAAELEHAERRLRALGDAYQAAQAEIESLHEQVRGAVEGLREIEAGEPLHRYEWCQAIARQTLAKIGPTYIKGP